MSHENIGDRGQSQKTTCHMIPFTSKSRLARSVVTETLVVAMGQGEGEREVTANGYGVPLWRDEPVLEAVVMVVQPCEYTK